MYQKINDHVPHLPFRPLYMSVQQLLLFSHREDDLRYYLKNAKATNNRGQGLSDQALHLNTLLLECSKRMALDEGMFLLRLAHELELKTDLCTYNTLAHLANKVFNLIV